MEVEILFFEGCPSHEAAVDLVRETSERLGIEVTVTEIDVRSDEEARRRQFLGSPSIRVDGTDIEPGAEDSRAVGRRCRVYPTQEGLSPIPPVAMLEAALKGEHQADEARAPTARQNCCAPTSAPTVQLLVAEWCPECPAAKSFWSDLQADEGFDLEIIDIESQLGSELAAQYGVRAVPATVINGSLEFGRAPIPDRRDAIARLAQLATSSG